MTTLSGEDYPQTLQDYRNVAVRGWTNSRKKVSRKGQRADPIRRMLVIDTETLTDTTQALTFGSAQLVSLTWRRRQPYNGTYLYEGCRIDATVIFHADDLEETDPSGMAKLVKYGIDRGITVVSRRVFMEHYFHYNVERRKSPSGKYLGTATAVFFNAPFDVSRLAEDVGYGRGPNKGAFSLLMSPLYEGSEDRFRRRIIVRHIDSKKALISYGYKTSLDDQDSDGLEDAGRGQFLDLRQLIWGMTGVATSLKSACEMYNLPDKYRKTSAESHGTITEDYIDYNIQDVTATRELAIKVLTEYARHPIDLQASKVFSPASISKAYIRKMGVTPMLDRPGFPSDPILLGNSISTFYGGRSECRIRRTPVPVRVLDFTSMYPTVNVLMRLWDHITAQRLDTIDATSEVTNLVNTVTVGQLLDVEGNPELWPAFVGMVQIVPDGDILPVRANYSDIPGEYNVGSNYLYANEPMWFTIPDVVASKLLTGKAPRIIRAVRFVPSAEKLPGLKPVMMFGSARVDPVNTDFFKTVVEERQKIKRVSSKGHPDTCGCTACLTAKIYKIVANSGSYGIYVEMQRKDLDRKRDFTVYGSYDQPWQSSINAEEEAQEFCYPLIGATITGAARLMLAILEKIVTDKGGSWLFCDTDSMAIVANSTGSRVPCNGGPHTMPDGRGAVRALSYSEIRDVCDHMNMLNPYDDAEIPLLKIETRTDSPECWGYMISAKRYALFNYDDHGRPIVPEKIDGKEAYSRHGLGMYLNPVDPELDSRDWIRQTWQHIIDEAHGLGPSDLPWLNRPAMTRVTISSPHVARSLDQHNSGRGYADSVKPFNFVLLTTNGILEPWSNRQELGRFIAPYTTDPSTWESPEWTWTNIYDRNADPIAGSEFDFTRMRNIVEAYARLQEPKSLGSDGKPCKSATTGLLRRRTVRILRLTHIGKETNRLEESNNGLRRTWSELTTEYIRTDINDTVAGFIRRYSRREFTRMVNTESTSLRPNDPLAHVYGRPVHVDPPVIDRYINGEQVTARNRDAVIRTVAKLIAPTVGMDPNNDKTVRLIVRSSESVIAMWRDSGKPSIAQPPTPCLCGCGRDAAARSKYASRSCRNRSNRAKRQGSGSTSS